MWSILIVKKKLMDKSYGHKLKIHEKKSQMFLSVFKWPHIYNEKQKNKLCLHRNTNISMEKSFKML
jgi:hypothetical protein